MSQKRPPDSWFDLYRKAILETDADALMGRMHLARAAIRARLSECSAQDHDEKSRLADALRNLSILEKEHRTAVQSGQVRHTDYVTLSSGEHRWIGVSEGICTLLSYSRAELVGRLAHEFVAPDLQEQTKIVFESLIRTGFSQGTHAVVRKDGQSVLLEYKARVLPDGSIISYWYPETNHEP